MNFPISHASGGRVCKFHYYALDPLAAFSSHSVSFFVHRRVLPCLKTCTESGHCKVTASAAAAAAAESPGPARV